MSGLEPEFSNQQLASSGLPQLQDLDFEPLDKRYRTVRRLTRLLAIALVLILLLFIQFQTFVDVPERVNRFADYAALAVIVLFLLSLCYVHFADKKKKFALREQDLSYHSGLFFFSTLTQPILRIQHVEIKQGPLERRFGLANIQVYSAGGELHTFQIPGLALAKAEQIRQFILSNKDIQQHG
ncbi:PH domain-containing protein [Paraferrimonas haliotis]|uniref:YdbS-like PH domain-containing protein n=1 Tax=Paraferrimonas haliotis TaxID=2013866 RepID=A0AA37WYT3_9GAMM|nr:PH domain-containing protein [Paraferrimonas haliotis]GLS84095.1 hypothetical protein GCM10007894_20720 [Paraferrimonas haliotis]